MNSRRAFIKPTWSTYSISMPRPKPRLKGSMAARWPIGYAISGIAASSTPEPSIKPSTRLSKRCAIEMSFSPSAPETCGRLAIVFSRSSGMVYEAQVLWRTHSCVPRSHFCERLVQKTRERCRDESRHGTQECVRHAEWPRQSETSPQGGGVGGFRIQREIRLRVQQKSQCAVHAAADALRRHCPRGGSGAQRRHLRFRTFCSVFDSRYSLLPG